MEFLDASSAKFQSAVEAVRAHLVYKGDPAPKSPAPRVDGQSVSSDGHEHIPSIKESCDDHIAMAKEFSIPDTNLITAPELIASAEYIVSHSDTPELIVKHRQAKMALLNKIKSSFAREDAAAKCRLQKFAKPVASRISFSLLKVMLKAVSYPDTELANDLFRGVPNIGDIPITHSHAPCSVPRTKSSLEPNYAARLIGSMRRRAKKATPQQIDGFEQCYQKTIDETEQGWADGPFTKDELDQEFPSGWHCSERFPQFRYEGAPCRPCDNFRTSGINDFNSYHERIVCENAGFPSRMGKHFYYLLREKYGAQQWPHHCNMVHGTDDFTKAYRQIPVRDYAYNIVAIWNPRKQLVEFFVIRGLCFGSAASVLQFNRYSQFMAFFSNAFFGTACASYYDDYDVAEPRFSALNSQNSLWQLHIAAGFLLDKGKHVRAAENNNPFLGVITDFTSFAQGKIYLRISASRKTKVTAMLSDVLTKGSLTAAQASSLRGKLYFCTLTAFNKVGRGMLNAFTARQYSKSTFLSSELRDAVNFFLILIPNMMPRCIDLTIALRSTLVIWSDAMYEARSGGLGFVAYDPDDDVYYYSAYKVPVWVYLFFRSLLTYIGQLELYAVLFCYLTLPASLLVHRPILHYIDNTSSMAGAIKGSSPKRDSAWIICVLHLVFSKWNIAPWFAYVASKANCSDGPSRFDFSYVRTRLRANWLSPVPLTLGQWKSTPADWLPLRPERRKRDSGSVRRAAKKKHESHV